MLKNKQARAEKSSVKLIKNKFYFIPFDFNYLIQKIQDVFKRA